MAVVLVILPETADTRRRLPVTRRAPAFPVSPAPEEVAYWLWSMPEPQIATTIEAGP